MKDNVPGFIANGLLYGLALFVLSFAIGCFPADLSLQKCFLMSGFMGFIAFVVGGFAFNRFPVSIKKLDKISIQFDDSDKILLQSPASHRIENKLIAGKLFLTERRLIFKTYGADEIQSDICSWHAKELMPDQFYPAVSNRGGEFLLKTKDDVSLMFEVDRLKPWKETLTSRLS